MTDKKLMDRIIGVTSKEDGPLMKEELLQMINETCDNSRFLIGLAENEEHDLREGACNVASKRVSKAELLDIVRSSSFKKFSRVPELPREIAINKTTMLLADGLYTNKAFETSDVDDYTRLADSRNDNYHVYVKLDKRRMTISFKLGDAVKTYTLVEKTTYVSKALGEKMYCISADHLENYITDPANGGRMILIARSLLGIKAPY